MQIWRLGVASLLVVHAACQHVGTWAIAESIKPDRGRGLKGKILEVAQFPIIHSGPKAYLQSLASTILRAEGFRSESADHMPIY